MKISQEFVVPRSPDVIWEFFQDVPAVAQCLPGAELTGQKDDGTYEGQLSSKMGPMTATFEGIATVTPDPAARTAIIEGKGVDKKGGSRGQVKVEVTVDADITLSGPVAQFGRTGLINEMSKRLILDFVSCLEAKLEATTEEEAEAVAANQVEGVSLFFASFWAWFRGLFKKGGDPV